MDALVLLLLFVSALGILALGVYQDLANTPDRRLSATGTNKTTTKQSKNMNTLVKKTSRKASALYWMLTVGLFAAIPSAARADTVDTAISSTVTLVTGYVTAIGGAMITIAVLWISFAVGAKYVRKLRGL